MDKKPLILIADDEDVIIDLEIAFLGDENYDFVRANNGEQALKIVAEQKVDLLLLDVMMPIQDGFQVCEILKGDNKTKNIPILMITVLSEKKHRIRAMEVGADDFLSKPVDETELQIRVKSLLRIKSYYDEIVASYELLQEKNVYLERLEIIKKDLTNMVVHDIKGPISGILGNIELVLMKSQSLSNDNVRFLQNSKRYTQDLSQMVNDIGIIAKLDKEKKALQIETTDIVDMTEHMLGELKKKAAKKNIEVHIQHNLKDPFWELDSSVIRRVIHNLTDNAVRHTPTNGTIEITLTKIPEEKILTWKIWNSGKGLPEEFHTAIFEKYKQVDNRESGIVAGESGLGLFFCKMAVEAHHGQLTVASSDNFDGTSFIFTLPLEQPA